MRCWYYTCSANICGIWSHTHSHTERERESHVLRGAVFKLGVWVIIWLSMNGSPIFLSVVSHLFCVMICLPWLISIWSEQFLSWDSKILVRLLYGSDMFLCAFIYIYMYICTWMSCLWYHVPLSIKYTCNYEIEGAKEKREGGGLALLIITFGIWMKYCD